MILLFPFFPGLIIKAGFFLPENKRPDIKRTPPIWERSGNFIRNYLPTTSLAAFTTFSTVKPNSWNSLAAGAEAP